MDLPKFAHGRILHVKHNAHLWEEFCAVSKRTEAMPFFRRGLHCDPIQDTAACTIGAPLRSRSISRGPHDCGLGGTPCFPGTPVCVKIVRAIYSVMFYYYPVHDMRTMLTNTHTSRRRIPYYGTSYICTVIQYIYGMV